MSLSYSFEGIAIPAIAATVPATTVDNDDLIAEGGDREYVERTSEIVGVSERRVVAPGEYGSDLAIRSAKAVLEQVGWARGEVDVLTIGTQTPDRLFPGIGFSVHKALDLSTDCAVFDVNLGCSAFVYGAWLMASTLPRPTGKGLLVTVDTMSRTLRADDIGNRVLFGDGAATTAFETTPDGTELHATLASDGRGLDYVCLPGTGMTMGIDPGVGFQINGPAVLGLALRSVPRLVGDLLERADISAADVGLFVPHQANRFILEKLRDRLEITPKNFVIEMESVGNTSSASIPIALSSEAVRTGGQDLSTTLMVGFGTGFSWGGILADLGRTELVGISDQGD